MSTIVVAISSERRHLSGPAVLHQLARHPPHHRGRLGFRNGASALGLEPRHRVGAVVAHAAEQDADQAGGGKLSSALVTIRSTLGCQG